MSALGTGDGIFSVQGINDFEPEERKASSALTVSNQEYSTHRNLYHSHKISIIKRPCLVFSSSYRRPNMHGFCISSSYNKGKLHRLGLRRTSPHRAHRVTGTLRQVLWEASSPWASPSAGPGLTNGLLWCTHGTCFPGARK